MSKVGIVTDSMHCLPAEFIRQYDIRVAPVTLVINGKAYRDQVDITASQFYALQKDLKNTVSSSGVPPGTFVDLLKETAKTYDKILCLVHSSSLGVTHSALMQAREMVIGELAGVTIEVVDTRTAAGAQGLIVLEAARAAEAGKDISEVAQAAQAIVPRAKWIMALETLKHLIKGGRAPRFAGTMANLIQMKPIIGMMNSTGTVDFSDRVRTSPKAMIRLVEITKRHIASGNKAHVIVHYADDIRKGENLKAMVAAELPCEELYLSEITPVVCCHTGPMVGLSFYS
ncbi:MAG: DegV family protein [Dehalococcoidia bacterium]